MSKISNQKKGEDFERKTSLSIHKDGIPFLVSSLVLRERNCGQVDLSILKDDSIYLFELKFGQILSEKQSSRLKRSAWLISSLLEKNVFIKLIFAK